MVLKRGIVVVGFPGGSYDKESACNVGDLGLITYLVMKIPWRREWLPTPVGNSYLEYSIARGAWRATVLRVKKS